MATFDIGIKWSVIGTNPLTGFAQQAKKATAEVKTAFQTVAAAGEQSGRKVQASWLKVSRKLRDVGSKLKGIAGNFNSLGGALAGLGAGAGLKSLVQAGVDANRLENALRLATGGGEEFNKVMAEANRLGAEMGLSGGQAQKGILDLYSTMKPLGVATEDIVTLFEGVTAEAGRMGVGADKVNGVMVQLSQGMATGALRTQDLKAIMNNMPTIMGALSESTGKTAGELLEMATNGELGTDVIINLGKALAEADRVKPDAFKQFAAEFDNFKSSLGQSIVPLLTPLLVALNGLLKVFNALPGPIKAIVGVLVLLAGAFAIVLPVIGLMASGFTAIAGVMVTLGPAIAAISAFIAGLVPIIKAVLLVLAGPAGWIAALVLLGVAIYTFRDQIGEAFNWIVQKVKESAIAFKNTFIDPVIEYMGVMVDAISGFMQSVPQFFLNAWQTVLGMAKEYVNGMLTLIENAINGMIRAINTLVSHANRALRALNLPTIPMAPQVEIPRLAKGGYVTGPTVAEIGEGGEPEYVIPQSKLGAAVERYNAGMRGEGMIPDSANVNVNYNGTTVEMGGNSYINRGDVNGIVNQAVSKTLNTLRRSPRARLGTGI